MGPVTRITGPSWAIARLLCNRTRKNFVVEENYDRRYEGLLSVVEMFCERDCVEMRLFGRFLCHQFADHACIYACASLFFV